MTTHLVPRHSQSFVGPDAGCVRSCFLLAVMLLTHVLVFKNLFLFISMCVDPLGSLASWKIRLKMIFLEFFLLNLIPSMAPAVCLFV